MPVSIESHSGASKTLIGNRPEFLRLRYPDEALGRSQGGWGTKIHMRVQSQGKPMVLLLTARQRHEQIMFEPLMETEAVKRAKRGRPRLRRDRIAGDKGYSSKKIRRYLRRRGIGVVIARQKRERRVRLTRMLTGSATSWSG
jgi:hypothetical protein